jgi:3-dehydroquinate dehydratase type I
MICVPVMEKTISGAVKAARQARHKIGTKNYIEVRLDFMNCYSKGYAKRVADMAQLIKVCGRRCIFTNRPVWEGGLYERSEKDRLSSLKDALNQGAGFIDIEMHTPRVLDFINSLKEKRSQVILSCHLDRTPVSISKTAKKLMKFNTGAIKLVTYAREVKDNFTMMKLLKNIVKRMGKEKKVIMFCMGKKGVLSRVICKECGSFLTFASVEKVSAEGQINYEMMRELLV